jgi:hypothetical protein
MKRCLRRVLGTALLTTLMAALGAVPTVWADPADPGDPAGSEVPAPALGPPPGPAPGPVAVAAEGGNPASDACKQFSLAVALAATNYEDFAYATAGNGNYVNYDDPTVQRANVVGRAALKEAAAVALDAAQTPGLPPEVSDPMRTWSLHATKLVLIMGLRGGGDSLNYAATQLNVDASNAQLACARGGM